MKFTRERLVSWELAYRQFCVHWLNIHSHSGSFLQGSRKCVAFMSLNTNAGVCHWKGCRWCATEQIGYTHFDIAVTLMRHMIQTYRVKLSTLWNDFLLFLTSACHLLSYSFHWKPFDLRHNACSTLCTQNRYVLLVWLQRLCCFRLATFIVWRFEARSRYMQYICKMFLKELLRNTQNVNKIYRRTCR